MNQSGQVGNLRRSRHREYLSLAKLVIVALLACAVVGTGVWFLSSWWFQDPLRQAKRALENGEFLSAARQAEAWLEAHPEDQEAMLLAARAYARMGRMEEAEAYFAQVPLEEKADFYARAAGLVKRKLWTEAGFVYEEILKRWPGEGSALDRLIRIRLQQQRITEAIKLAQRLKALPGWEATGYLLLGLLEFERLQYVDAAKYLEEALKLVPDLDPDKTHVEKDVVLLVYAECLYNLGRVDEAIQYAEQARDMANKPEPCYILGLCYQQKGDMKRARQFFEEAVARDPANMRAILELGRLSLLERNPEEARRWFEKATKLDPTEDGAWQGLIAAYRALGQNEKADEILRQRRRR